MKILSLLLASIALAGVESARGPELQISGTTVIHSRTDGNCHVPRSFGKPAGYQLTTNGGSCDLFWAAPGGAFVDSARVAGLSDSAKALVRYARTAAVHDTADTLRTLIAAKEPAIPAGTALQYVRGDKTVQTLNTTVVPEGTNLYYTDARARNAITYAEPIFYNPATGVIAHYATDGNLHVPATGTGNNGRFLKAGATSGSIAWAPLVAGDIPALPAYVRRIGDTITGPIVGTTAAAAPLINITTTFGNLTNAAIRGTATAANGSALHGVATGANGVGVWGSSTGSTGDGGFFYGANGSNALRAYAIGSGDAGRFEGNVKILGTTTLASSLTGILKANAGVVSAADTSDFPTRPYLPLAAGSGSPLTGVLYGQGLNFTTTTNAPITISQNLAGGFTHPLQAFNSGMVAGNQYNFDFGQSASTNNAGNFGFKYVGAGSASNYVTLGMYGANDLLTITAAGVPKFSGLTASKFVKTDASKNLVSTDVAYSDLTGTVPAWNQSTTGNAATATKWATARNLTIGSSTQAIDGTSDKTFTLAAIGAQAAGSYQPLENQRLSTSNSPSFAEVSASNKITAGPAQMSGWSADPTVYARFGHSSWNSATGFGYLQRSSGEVYLEAPTGSTVQLRISGADVITANAAGSTLAGTTTLSALTGATTRMATISATGQIGAVDIGQSVESRVAPGSAVTVAHNTTVNITSISLSAGEWDVSGQATSVNGGTGNFVTNFWTGTTATSATIPTDGTDGNSGYQTVAPNTQSTPAGTKRFILGSTTTVYLVGKVLMSSGSGSVTVYGWISATRAK